ncbi:hypothetical protein N781_00585 [Pontibacillus halophilus JSM 076056 = DSM 19796]|uniref:DUF4183 domain-containing protein n=1 Tax=Pontibacillus halophilus JSM 076056 = DSM 19796 TaxID=1385510 RepID=A0A0A5GKC3_9BACI|nr:DUF4183 domain-containing protein [Pontibacillus halophilus]KGX93736.1 hypothetical protein N781_00585 [Pontibacillus halophilus JSM 076056 = DSM 19796]
MRKQTKLTHSALIRTLAAPKGCPNLYPPNPLPPQPKETLIKADVYYYYTVADGTKTIYTERDAIVEYGDQGIFPKEQCTYVNLFINGMIQPDAVYSTGNGYLILPEAPDAGVPIILQFVIMKI